MDAGHFSVRGKGFVFAGTPSVLPAGYGKRSRPAIHLGDFDLVTLILDKATESSGMLEEMEIIVRFKDDPPLPRDGDIWTV